jgi:hypothetical protein
MLLRKDRAALIGPVHAVRRSSAQRVPAMRLNDSDRLLARVMAHAAGENANLANPPVEHGLGNPGHLGRIVQIDHRRTMFRRRPGAQLVADDFHDLETQKHPVIDPGPEKAVELRLQRQLLDFRGME